MVILFIVEGLPMVEFRTFEYLFPILRTQEVLCICHDNLKQCIRSPKLKMTFLYLDNECSVVLDCLVENMILKVIMLEQSTEV